MGEGPWGRLRHTEGPSVLLRTQYGAPRKEGSTRQRIALSDRVAGMSTLLTTSSSSVTEGGWMESRGRLTEPNTHQHPVLMR